MTDARRLAARVLVRVARDEAFAAAALEAELSRAVQMSDRDRALATELVYGTLRVLPFLRAEIDALAKKPTTDLPWEVQAALWLAAEQIFFLRVPDFAAVNEAVSAVRTAAGAKIAGFANALLRKLAASAPSQDDQASLRARAVLESCPADVRLALARALGDEGQRAFLREPGALPVGLRVRETSSRDAMLARLREARPHAELVAGACSALCINALRLGTKPQSLPGYEEGDLSVQEEGSQVVALSLAAAPGERVLDACAGRGNKTAILALAGSEVTACDRDPRKLEKLAQDLRRQRTTVKEAHPVDWTVGSGDVTGRFDAILVDAPCSGIGTLRRRPEMLLRPQRPLHERTTTQTAILRGVSRHLAPSGRLVYTVCSVLREEAEDVVSAVGDILEPVTTRRILPHVEGTDGYFIATFRCRGS
jgi:16S rRNA (cytosine967-C5)-methyltransferase